jgi:hypothetical protein
MLLIRLVLLLLLFPLRVLSALLLFLLLDIMLLVR